MKLFGAEMKEKFAKIARPGQDRQLVMRGYNAGNLIPWLAFCRGQCSFIFVGASAAVTWKALRRRLAEPDVPPGLLQRFQEANGKEKWRSYAAAPCGSEEMRNDWPRDLLFTWFCYVICGPRFCFLKEIVEKEGDVRSITLSEMQERLGT